MWFPSSLPTDHPPMFKFRDDPDADTDPSAALVPLPFPLPVSSIPAAAAIPIVPSDDPPLPFPPVTGAALHTTISLSSDRLFFVSYRPAAGTLRPRWYLVQIDLPQSLSASPACASDGLYYCHSLGTHPDDTSLPDPARCWWLLLLAIMFSSIPTPPRILPLTSLGPTFFHFSILLFAFSGHCLSPILLPTRLAALLVSGRCSLSPPGLLSLPSALHEAFFLLFYLLLLLLASICYCGYS
jgi:hypothetical protein